MILNKNNYKDIIDAKIVNIGINVSVGERTKIIGSNGPADYVEIGDNVFLDDDIFIMAPSFILGDYSKIYKHCRISGYAHCEIGHNFWCDQNTIINCTDTLKIGNNVGIGAYSQLWTHVKYGDILEGCRFNTTKPMIIGDDVWFVGHCIVSPIYAQKKSMALVGSVITKDMEENHIYGGSPAIDLTDRLGPQFSKRSIDEKMSMMKSKFKEFNKSNNCKSVDFIKIIKKFPEVLKEDVSYFNVSERTYIKRLTPIEIKFMQFILPLYKFTPANYYNA